VLLSIEKDVPKITLLNPPEHAVLSVKGTLHLGNLDKLFLSRACEPFHRLAGDVVSDAGWPSIFQELAELRVVNKRYSSALPHELSRFLLLSPVLSEFPLG
jgi:hypothetical protein